MSTVLSSPEIHQRTEPAARFRLPAWLREPLLHFLLLGAVLFAIDAVIAAHREDPHTIVIDAEVDSQAREVFETSRGRPPTAEELQALRQVWLDNEVLYREGLAMGLDRGDKSIRERVIFKALSVVDASSKRPPYEEQVLREWFGKNRAKYDEPTRYDFQEAALSGDSSEVAVRAFVSALNAGTSPDAQAGLRVFTARPQNSLVQSYGSDFVQALGSSPPGEWRAIHSQEGWRAVRLESTTPPRPADFEQLRGVVLQDWTDATMAEQRSAAVRALARKYKIRTDGVSG